MSQPLVSVIIPCYRQGRYLARSVGSALEQSYPAIEVIVIDDGSDDETGEVVHSLGDRVRYVRRANGGPAAARNTGVAVARGKYLLFLDADDLLHPDAVAWLVTAAGGREDVLCAFGVRRFELDEDLESGRICLPPSEAPAVGLLVDNFCPPLAFLCSRAALQAAGGFDPSRRVDSCEDWDMWVRLVFGGAEVVTIPRVGAYYRQHPTSHSRNKARTAASMAEVRYRTVRRTRTDPELSRRLGVPAGHLVRILRRLIANDHRCAAYHNRQQGRYWQALGHYAASLYRGRPTWASVLGLCKLLPHKLVSLLRWRGPGTPGRLGRDTKQRGITIR